MVKSCHSRSFGGRQDDTFLFFCKIIDVKTWLYLLPYIANLSLFPFFSITFLLFFFLLLEYSRHKEQKTRNSKTEGSDHAPVYVSLIDIPSIQQHNTPSLSTRYCPQVYGCQQTLGADFFFAVRFHISQKIMNMSLLMLLHPLVFNIHM